VEGYDGLFCVNVLADPYNHLMSLPECNNIASQRKDVLKDSDGLIVLALALATAFTII
jgi:hypothetical protein